MFKTAYARFLKIPPFWQGVIGAACGVSAYGLLHLTASLEWIEKHNGLASWVQAVGSVAAIAWGVWLYRAALLQGDAAKHEARRNALTIVRTVSKNHADMCRNIGKQLPDKGNQNYARLALSVIEQMGATANMIAIDHHFDDRAAKHVIFLRTSVAAISGYVESIAQLDENDFAKYVLENANGDNFISSWAVTFDDIATELATHVTAPQ